MGCIYIVPRCETTASDGNRGFLAALDSSNDGYELRYDGGSGNANFAVNGSDVLVSVSGQFLWLANYDGTTQTNSINGTASTKATTQTISVTNAVSVGVRLTGNTLYNWDGNIQEAVIYPSDQFANRTGIESNINTYYSIYP